MGTSNNGALCAGGRVRGAMSGDDVVGPSCCGGNNRAYGVGGTAAEEVMVVTEVGCCPAIAPSTW